MAKEDLPRRVEGDQPRLDRIPARPPAHGWYHTSDAGFLDAQGHLKIIDRVKDVGRIKGGANDGAMFAPKYVENKLKFFPYIKEAVAFGDARGYTAAFVNIDLPAVGNWAEKRNLPYAGYVDLASRDEVYELVRECIEKVNADLAAEPELAGSQIHRFLILHKELDPDDDELTRTRKVRRGFIADPAIPAAESSAFASGITGRRSNTGFARSTRRASRRDRSGDAAIVSRRAARLSAVTTYGLRPPPRRPAAASRRGGTGRRRGRRSRP